MKKLGLLFKEASGGIIKTSIKEAGAVLIVKYSGVSSPDLTTLRLNLKTADARLFVVKNSVARKALKDCQLEPIIKSIEGPCGLIFVKEEPVEASRVLCNFVKEHEQLKLEGGLLQERVLEKKDIELMSKLPSKHALRTQVVTALNSPILNLAIVLNQTLRKFVICLDQIKQKRENEK